MYLPHACLQMRTSVEDPRLPVEYHERVREYVIPAYEPSSMVMELLWCPWCGERLPESLRDELGDRLEALDLSIFDEDIPAEYKTDEWWRRPAAETT